jgi:hypothetical protein
VVWGIDKLKQDLQLAVAERFGGDRFHPEMGSILQDYIGTVISPRTEAAIHDEVLRVLDNYQKIQMYGFKRNSRLYSMDELLEEIKDISISMNYDTVAVSVEVRTAARKDAKITVNQGV